MVISLLDTDCEIVQKCFFRQFFHSVAKVDYLTLRHGFIAVMIHLQLCSSKFYDLFLGKTGEGKCVVDVTVLINVLNFVL